MVYITSQRKSTFFLIFSVLCFVISVVDGIFILITGNFIYSVFIMIAFVFLLPSIIAIYRNSFFEEPIGFVGFSFAFFYIVSAYGTYKSADLLDPNFWYAILLILLSYILIVVSYLFKNRIIDSIGHKKHDLILNYSPVRYYLCIGLYIIVGFIALQYNFASSGGGILLSPDSFTPPALQPERFQGLKWDIPLLSAPIVAIVFIIGYMADKNNRWTRFIILLYLVSLFYVYGKLGSRSRLLMILLTFLGSYNFLINKLSSRTISLVLGAAFVLLVVYGNIRDTLFSASSDQIISRTKEIDLSEYTSAHGDMVVFGATKDILRTYPDKYEYFYGVTLVTPITNYIPRVLWSEKPLSAAAIYTSQFYPTSWEKGATSTTGFVGELYMNGGIIFVVIFSILFGWFLRFVRHWGRGKKVNSITMIIYIMTLVPLSTVARGDIAFVFGTMLNNIILVATGFFIIGFRRVRRRVETS